MKKTYKTFNGENRNCFFKVGKALVEARFTPTYITDNEFVQKAIEESFSFKAGELQLVERLQWIKIDRDKNGFATEECLDKMFSNLPIVVMFNLYDGRKVYEGISETDYVGDWRGDIDRDTNYTHYLPIPKLEE